MIAAVGIAITFGNETLRAQAIIAPPPIHSHRQGYSVQRRAARATFAVAAADGKTPPPVLSMIDQSSRTVV